ncbi:unnamed protein product [Adineta steineri]|uniref:ubiquitinyl hydrolase 1 n=1 Tax=Adineta steineri TaxID=433720 RepID=A0A819GQ58_9BILA|nr:unnamed protein product [Adineta steineri]
MTPGIIHEPHQFPSYKFEDSNKCIILKLYANGAIEQKDVDINCISDCLEVATPNGQSWKFDLYAHIYSEQTEVTAKINENRTQTIIELRLFKQERDIPWPQLHSRQSIPTIIEVSDSNIDMKEDEIHSSIEEEPPYDLSIKKIPSSFQETYDNRVIVHFSIRDVYNCHVQFTETNFTVTFHTKDENFHQLHSISPTVPIKLVVRVKGRINSEQCHYKITPVHIEIYLIKDSEHQTKWYQLEPNEYSDINSSYGTSSAVLGHPRSEIDEGGYNRITRDHETFVRNAGHGTFARSADQEIFARTAGQQTILRDKVTGKLPALTMDRVLDNHPTGSSFYHKDITQSPSVTSSIGYTGIYNPANSCFMNAALQCLSNTRELRDYFLKSYYCVELNRTNPLGMKGIMAEEFATVIKNLWSGTYNHINANRLRDYVAKRHQEFVGNGQHDAQELLTILLDALHEDLNRVQNKPQVPPIEDENRPDYVLADEYWRGYLSRNDSLIVELFTGQFKSKTKCPQCLKESVTFDPFTSLSVPLPKRIAVDTIVTFRNDEKSSTKYRIIMSADGSITEFKRLLSDKCGLSTAKMLAYKLQGNRNIEYLKDDDRITSSTCSWNTFDIIYITEILTSADCDNETIHTLTFFQRIFKIPDYISSCAYCQALPNPHSTPKFCKNCYQVSYCDEQCLDFHKSDHRNMCEYRSKDNSENIGNPFIISLPESKLTYENVFEQINIHTKRYVDIHIDRSKRTQQSFGYNRGFNGYDRVTDDDDEEDSFSDIENVDWITIKKTLSSSDSWSICRIGDYLVKTNKNKRRHNQEKDRKDKILKNISTNENNDEEPMIVNGDSESVGSSEDFDMLDDIYGSQPLFRIMPRPIDNQNNNVEPIVEPGDDANNVLRGHRTFSIDWYTDNKIDAPLRVTPSIHRMGINDLIEDASVFNSLSGDQEITLQQCLQLFIEPEVLGADDKWYCPHCKEHIQAEKKMSVWRLPPILIIHLKRFKYNHCSSSLGGYISSSREKLDTTVKYPVHNLNMAPYCSSIPEENPESNDLSQSRYDLYGIVNHRGSAWFGHYTSYARLLANNDSAKTEIGWRNFDDERVSSLTNVKDLVRSDAYVLFYRHRSLSVDFTVQEEIQRVLAESSNLYE